MPGGPGEIQRRGAEPGHALTGHSHRDAFISILATPSCPADRAKSSAVARSPDTP